MSVTDAHGSRGREAGDVAGRSWWPAGTGLLARHALRRDRLVLPLWIVGVTLLYWSQAVGVMGLYASEADLAEAAAPMENNAALVAMAGPARALDTYGGQVAWQSLAFGAVVVAFMCAVTLARHTRADEESGRFEIVLASAVGRAAPLCAASIVAVGASLVAGGLVTVALLSTGLPVAGSISCGVGLFLVGCVFTGIAAVAAQLTDGPRAMYGVVGAVVGLAYALRAVGDVAQNGLSWLTPIGWYQAMWPYSGERWWPALLFVVAGVAAAALAAALFARRDLGRGLWAARPGPAAGDLRDGSLARRLQRASLIGWTVGLLLVGVTYGSLGDEAGDMLGDSDVTTAIFGSSDDLVAAFHATALLMQALLTAGFAISSALRPRGEESAGRLELLLSTPLPRLRWLGGHLAVTVGGTVLLLAASGLGLGLGYAGVTGRSEELLAFVVPSLTFVPPVLVLVGLTVLLLGWLPRAAPVAWAALVLCVVVMLFGDLLDLPEAVVDLSPFSHVAQVPAEDVRVLPLLVLSALAATLLTAGAAGFRRRDTA